MPDDVRPFRIAVADCDLVDLRERLARTRWPEMETVDDWSQGMPLAYLQPLVRHWFDGYDWRARETRLNTWPQFHTDIDGLPIHFLHVRSSEPDALPVVITHGWPGSIVEFLDVLGPLTDPAAHGGDAGDAFHVVCPSLPGYGWSGKPTRAGWGVERTARAWAQLMARLGYDRYGAQGGDWGSMVTTAIGQLDPEHLAGIHINMVIAGPGPGDGEPTPEEKEASAGLTRFMSEGSGYSHQQSTRPQTLGYGLVDSPVGQCAWILEKFHAWTDTGGDPIGMMGADRLLDNVMVYWLTATGASSARLYWESGRGRPNDPVEVPMGASIYPREVVRASRRWAAHQYRDIRYWAEMPRGGHFAAMEQPELFVGELRRFFRDLR